jgi:hypothetical protein
MCDDEIRVLMKENFCENRHHVTYLSETNENEREELSGLFIKQVLTSSAGVLV